MTLPTHQCLLAEGLEKINCTVVQSPPREMLVSHLSDGCRYALAKPKPLLQAGQHAAGARAVPLTDLCENAHKQLAPGCGALRQDSLPGGCCSWGCLQAAVQAGVPHEEMQQVLQPAPESIQAAA